MTQGLKIISAATGVVEPCADVSTGGEKRSGGVYLLFAVLSVRHVATSASAAQCRYRCSFIYSITFSIWQPPLTPPIWTVLITHYFQMITAEVFANSKAIWLIRAFGLTVHNRPHVPPSACRYCITKAAPPALFIKMYFIPQVCFCQLHMPSPFGCLYVQNLNNHIFNWF